MIDTSKFNSLIDVITTFSDEQNCIDYLTTLRWDGHIVSPFDSESKVYLCKGNKYKCKNTGKYFNVKTNTLFDNTKIKLSKWFGAIYLVTSHKKGISSIQLSKDIGVTQKTAWFMLQRIRACFGIDDNEKMDGVVQADETFVGGAIKNKPKHVRAKRNEKSRQTGMIHKVPVFGMMKDNVKVLAYKIDKPSKRTIQPELGKHVAKDATVVTDGFGGYTGIGEYFKKHIIVDHGKNEFVKDGFHTNSLEGFWSIFKRGILGIYHQVSRKHIDKYLSEFSFRYNTRNMNEAERMNVLFSQLEVRTTYKNLINE